MTQNRSCAASTCGRPSVASAAAVGDLTLDDFFLVTSWSRGFWSCTFTIFDDFCLYHSLVFGNKIRMLIETHGARLRFLLKLPAQAPGTGPGPWDV